MRPDWRIVRYDDPRVDLSNNLCYDVILNQQISNIMKTVDLNLRSYPDEARVYDSLSQYYDIDSSNIAIGYGIGELIQRILNLETGLISIVSPTWQMVEVFSKINGADYTTQYDDTAPIVYVASPNGITGQSLTKNKLHNLCAKHKLVILDEAYSDFNGVTHVHDVLEYDNLIVLKTLSKTLSLAGLRLGYAFAHEDIVSRLQLNRPSCVMNGVAIGIVDYILPLIKPHVDRMLETRSYIESTYDCTPSDGNFVILHEKPDFVSRYKVKRSPDHIRMALINKELVCR